MIHAQEDVAFFLNARVLQTSQRHLVRDGVHHTRDYQQHDANQPQPHPARRQPPQRNHQRNGVAVIRLLDGRFCQRLQRRLVGRRCRHGHLNRLQQAAERAVKVFALHPFQQRRREHIQRAEVFARIACLKRLVLALHERFQVNRFALLLLLHQRGKLVADILRVDALQRALLRQCSGVVLKAQCIQIFLHGSRLVARIHRRTNHRRQRFHKFQIAACFFAVLLRKRFVERCNIRLGIGGGNLNRLALGRRRRHDFVQVVKRFRQQAAVAAAFLLLIERQIRIHVEILIEISAESIQLLLGQRVLPRCQFIHPRRIERQRAILAHVPAQRLGGRGINHGGEILLVEPSARNHGSVLLIRAQRPR